MVGSVGGYNKNRGVREALLVNEQLIKFINRISLVVINVEAFNILALVFPFDSDTTVTVPTLSMVLCPDEIFVTEVPSEKLQIFLPRPYSTIDMPF